MKISEIGEKFHQDYVDRISYFSDDYLLDSDILIIDLKKVEAEIYLLAIPEDNGSGWLTWANYEYITSKIIDRKKQLSDYFNGGGNLWTNMPKQKILTIEVQQEDHSFEDIQIDLLGLVTLDSNDFVTESKKGSNILFSEPIFQNFFQEFKCSYNFSYSKHKGRSIATIKNSKQPVSIILSKSRGNIILMPEFIIDADTYDDFEMINSQIGKVFATIDAELKSRYKVIPDVLLPEWCNSYYLSNEGAQVKKLNQLFEQRDQIQQKIQQQQLLLSSYQELKQMLCAGSSILEQRVRQIFIEFGYQLLHTEENRDDLIIAYKENIAVIEVKGQKGSAAESNAAQLMKWVSTYHHDKGISPKGILIINAFKDIPLFERNQNPFPDQMLPYCKKMELALLTTSQLLGLYLDFKTGDISLRKIHAMLWDTIGPLNYVPTKLFRALSSHVN